LLLFLLSNLLLFLRLLCWLSDKRLLLPGVPLCGHPELVTRRLLGLCILPHPSTSGTPLLLLFVLLGLGAMFGLVHIMISARDHLVEGVSRALV